MKIYTKTGDDGSTGLIDGSRVPKSSLRVDAYGTIDELNSVIGLALGFVKCEIVSSQLEVISNLLFVLGSELANPKFDTGAPDKIGNKHVAWLESNIDSLTQKLPRLTKFILPGGDPGAAFIHLARTVSRRAERLAVRLANEESIDPLLIKFINRLSDYLFTAARYVNFVEGIGDSVRDANISSEI